MLNRPGLALCIALAMALPACKIVKNSDDKAEARGGGAASQGDMTARVDAMWDAEVMPHLEQSATDLSVLKPAIVADLDTAGTVHGYRPTSEGSPWNFPVRFAGTIVAANTESRAATADIDIDGDGTADAIVQLGPVIKGTTLRDVLPFVDFTAFRDQIEFAQLSRALNTKAYDTTLAELPRDDLVGQDIVGLGGFTLKSATDPILITPVLLATEDGS